MGIELREARADDAETVWSVMTQAAAGLDDPTLYVADDLAFVRRHLGDEGFTALALLDGVPVGFCLVRYPGTQADNLGREISLGPTELARVAHVESVAVLPAARGRGLQNALVSWCEDAVRQETRWLMCTVAPANVHSLANFLALGYAVVATTTKYGGLERHVLVKDRHGS